MTPNRTMWAKEVAEDVLGAQRASGSGVAGEAVPAGAAAASWRAPCAPASWRAAPADAVSWGAAKAAASAALRQRRTDLPRWTCAVPCTCTGSDRHWSRVRGGQVHAAAQKSTGQSAVHVNKLLLRVRLCLGTNAATATSDEAVRKLSARH